MKCARLKTLFKIPALIMLAGGVCCLTGLTPGMAQPISSQELIQSATQFDGETVTFAGEVIGDVMARGEFAWINLNDGQYALGCWVPRDLLRDIKYAGSYKYKGDWLEVAGVFHHVCLVHGGDLDIHVQSLRLVAQGEPVLQQLSQKKIYLAIILLGLLCLTLILNQLKLKPSKK